jgi:hypothetical protein
MRAIFLVALVVVLGVYSVDCGAAMTPEQAMRCCDSMPCSSQSQHGQDCCDRMPAMHASFVQPASVDRVSFVPVVFAVLQASIEPQCGESSDGVIEAFAHDPPLSLLSASIPLRI